MITRTAKASKKSTIPAGWVGGWVGGGWITLGIMQTQPSLAGVGAWAELGKNT